MIRNVRIETLEQLTPLLTEQEYRPDLLRNRSPYLYRGMANSSFRMVTSLRRNCKDLQQRLEPAILKNFAKYAEAEDPEISHSIWRQMILGQHHGLPTRLLDWSFSPLVSMHFALTEFDLGQLDQHDCVIWRMDIDELHGMLPERYQKVMEKESTTAFSLKMLQEACSGLVQYDEDMQGKAMLIVEPPSIEQRIVNQFSFFSIIPSGMEDIEAFLNEHTNKTVRFIIKKEIRWRARDLLDQLNISERIIYPGLDGLSRWLERHYYVK
jgi:hypothetical protein